MASTDDGSLGRGNLLKALTNQGSTTTSTFPAYELWSRDSRSLPPISPSQISSDGTLEQFNASDYKSSVFPSLVQRLSIKPKRHHKIKSEVAEGMTNKPKLLKSHRKSRSFFEEMQRRNESQYLRIQTVAKEQMAIYEKYAQEMEEKIKRQREEMQQRAQLFLQKLADQEEKRKEENIYRSSYGRIWRHHRTMQRRVLNLESMNSSSRTNGNTEII